jgi:hypothetical protein
MDFILFITFVSIFNTKLEEFYTSILNDQQYYNPHTLIDTIKHTSHNNISTIQIAVNQKMDATTAVLLAPSSVDNSSHGTEKFLLNTEVNEDCA